MASDVSNAEILKKLETHDTQFEVFNKRMEEQGKRLDLFIEMMKDVPHEIKGIREDMRNLDNRLRKVEHSINGIKITWDNRLFGGTLAVSAATAAVVAYIMVTALV